MNHSSAKVSFAVQYTAAYASRHVMQHNQGPELQLTVPSLLEKRA
jgi:hypothetical protein